MPPRSDAGSARTQTAALADTMVEVLATQARPLTLRHLGILADANASDDLIRRAARTLRFRDAAIAARSDDLEAPVALLTNLEVLAESPLTLRYLLNLRAKNKTRAYTAAKLKESLTGRSDKRLRKQFQLAITQQLVESRLPLDVGCVMASGGKPHLFRLQDLRPEVWRTAIEKSQGESLDVPSDESDSSPSDFPRLFVTAFEQLDREQGGFNFVPLESLRVALSAYSRDEFDSQLRELRLARRFRLSGAENRSDVSTGQREAGIREAGSLLLYAQRTGS